MVGTAVAHIAHWGWVPWSLLALAGAAGYSVTRVLHGLQMSLYLVDGGAAAMADPAPIPVAFAARKHRLLNTLKKRLWDDDVTLVLMDHRQRGYQFRIRFGLWRRFTLETQVRQGAVRLNGRELDVGRRYGLRSGMRLHTGGRDYQVVLTRRSHHLL
ncbi:MAG TPA: hypothetical protein VL588_07175 [Bdellovibrionota bacterium]|nr:hypothetical protein [Bdellovibrionota bacterium]